MLSYLVSTAGHSQGYNEEHPHDIRSIVQLIEEGAAESEGPVVGFPELREGWTCKYYSYRQLLRLSNGTARQLETRGLGPGPASIGLLCPSNADFLIAWIALMRLGYGVLLIAPQCSASAIRSMLKSTESVKLIYHRKYRNLALHSASDAIELPEPTEDETRPSIRGDISHIFHSSGTSGTPKPIPQTHLGIVSALPRSLPEAASFTTTPLFHGGVSDLLRAWMARSMLYLYPTSEVPITTRHVCDAVAACTSAPVDSFLSVPYILTILCDPQGIKLLKSMSLVSTGGAPLAQEVGDRMVESGIRLVSRLGSSECGFLLSSFRDFNSEKDWDWLRNDSPYSHALKFEPVGNLYELVVGQEWKSKTKTNRENGSYATGDLYRMHPKKANVWQYAGRGDDVIVMSNGEKASPGVTEDLIRQCPLVREAIVVGGDRPSLGLLVFSDHPEVLEAIKPYLDEANRKQPTFAVVHTEMCLISTDYERIPRASKGTVQRGLANEAFAGEIASLWDEKKALLPRRSGEEIEAFLTETVGEVLGRQLEGDLDLFSAGVDSLKATMIRSKIVKNVNVGDRSVPLNVVFESSTIASLASYLFDLQEGNAEVDPEQADLDVMWQWAEQYGSFQKPHLRAKGKSKTLLLTGATGSLGSEILRAVAETKDYDRIVCLVRAQNDDKAESRLGHVMKTKGIRWPVEVRAADLLRPDLGLDESVRRDLFASDLTIVHAAWPVHFGTGLRSFEDSIKGLRNLLDLPGRMIFCSSLASVLNTDPVKEEPSSDPRDATSVGYSRSKWVAEQICLKAQEIGMDVRIMRLGQLCGNSRTGEWNETEGWPLLLRTAQTTGCLPMLKEIINWLPVDVAARAILEISAAGIYNIVHPRPVPWTTVLEGVEKSGSKFTRVTRQEWLQRVEQSSEDVIENPSRKMLWLWQQADKSTDRTIETSETSTTLSSLSPLTPEHFSLSIAAWRRSGFLA